jgi:hypothetical protein
MSHPVVVFAPLFDRAHFDVVDLMFLRSAQSAWAGNGS